MATIQFSIPQVRPLQLTHPRFDADEIYLAYVVYVGRIEGTATTPAAGRLSAIRETGVKKPLHTWVPTTNGHATPDGMAIEVDVGDVDVVTIHLHLYEADDQNLWHEMAKNEKLNQLLDPEQFDWVNAIKPLKDIPKVCSKAQTKEELAICVIRQLVKAAKFAVDYLKQDDLLDEKVLTIPLGASPSSLRDRGTNTWKIDRQGGQYEVTTQVVVIE